MRSFSANIFVFGMILIMPVTTVAEDISKQQFLSSLNAIILESCSNTKMLSCLGLNEDTCYTYMERSTQQCSDILPNFITEIKVEQLTDGFGECMAKQFSTGLNLSKERIDQCDTQSMPNESVDSGYDFAAISAVQERGPLADQDNK